MLAVLVEITVKNNLFCYACTKWHHSGNKELLTKMVEILCYVIFLFSRLLVLSKCAVMLRLTLENISTNIKECCVFLIALILKPKCVITSLRTYEKFYFN